VTPVVWVTLGSLVVAGVGLMVTMYDKLRTTSKKIAWRLLPASSLNAAQLKGRWRSIRYTVLAGAQEIVLLQPRVVDILIVNVGKNAVTAANMSIPPRVAIADGSLVDVEVSLLTKGGPDVTPLEIVEVAGNVAKLAPLTLNPRDALVISLLVDGGVAAPTVTMQAVDFEFARMRSLWTRRSTYTTAIAVLFALVAVVALLFNQFPNMSGGLF
jgi:hypothetical protein